MLSLSLRNSENGVCRLLRTSGTFWQPSPLCKSSLFGSEREDDPLQQKINQIFASHSIKNRVLYQTKETRIIPDISHFFFHNRILGQEIFPLKIA